MSIDDIIRNPENSPKYFEYGDEAFNDLDRDRIEKIYKSYLSEMQRSERWLEKELYLISLGHIAYAISTKGEPFGKESIAWMNRSKEHLLKYSESLYPEKKGKKSFAFYDLSRISKKLFLTTGDDGELLDWKKYSLLSADLAQKELDSKEHSDKITFKLRIQIASSMESYAFACKKESNRSDIGESRKNLECLTESYGSYMEAGEMFSKIGSKKRAYTAFCFAADVANEGSVAYVTDKLNWKRKSMESKIRSIDELEDSYDSGHTYSGVGDDALELCRYIEDETEKKDLIGIAIRYYSTAVEKIPEKDPKRYSQTLYHLAYAQSKLFYKTEDQSLAFESIKNYRNVIEIIRDNDLVKIEHLIRDSNRRIADMEAIILDNSQ